MKDVVLEGDAMTLSREAVVFTWANIVHQWNQPSFLGAAGYAVKELAERPTHLITVRYGLQLEYSSAAWVYEQRLKSPPRWYKIVGFSEQERWVMLHCHLVEKSDKVTKLTQICFASSQVDVNLRTHNRNQIRGRPFHCPQATPNDTTTG